MNIESIPIELKQRNQWVLWRLERRNGRWTKPPYQVNGEPADKMNPFHWTSFQNALEAFSKAQGQFNGLGYVISSDDPYTVIDLDKCIIDGRLTDQARSIVESMHSYTERSQSGQGLHIFVRAMKPGTRCKNQKQGFEMYDGSAYIAITGDHLPGTPGTIEERQNAVVELYRRYLDKPNKKEKTSELPVPKSPPMDDETIIIIACGAENGEKFRALYSGDWSGYGSQSEADQALCNMLAFYTQNPEQIDRLFRYSGLMREKWERDDYREETIRKAICDLESWYGWRPPEVEFVKKSQSHLITELAEDMEFFHTPDNEAYVRLNVRGHYENWKVRSTNFKTLLAKMFYDKHKKVPGSQALADAQNVLEGRALHEGEERRVYLRVAETESAIYVDLGNEQWQAVQITPEGWQVVQTPPVMFKRTKTMAPLPIPQPGGNIELLRPFLNVKSDDDFMLIVAWVLAAYRDRYPFPILTIQGEQGSAKSTSTKIIRSLVDPSSQPLHSFPDNERDVAIKANGTWVLAFDNLSGVPPKMSDILCKLSTGGGFSTRKLHTDDEEAVFNTMRPLILNGIDDIAKRPDLLDRALILNLPTIDSKVRKAEREFWQEFEQSQPLILGAIFDAVAEALAHLDQVNMDDMPRMIDFAKWASAAWLGSGWDILYGDFMSMYRQNQQLAIDQGIESDPFAMAIIRFMENRDRWEGSPTTALREIGAHASLQDTYSRAWPAANKLKERVRRIAPALRSRGIEFVELPRSGKERKIAFIRAPDYADTG